MANFTKTNIIWNGCDGYNYAEAGEKNYTRTETFSAFEVVEVQKEDVPVDADGALDFDGLFTVESDGRTWKFA
jgi:hypothetical protein